ncbi:uncharacterized protein [Anabrus simplex]|uniref:uncharacterized protein n=1 Tax=Anabrus simplex TaxID=316456 RepID=UPI0035A3AEC7
MTSVCIIVVVAVVALAGATQVEPLANGLLLADPKNCSSYYEFVPQLRHCPSGLVFNPKQQMCDWPANVDCSCNGNGTSGGGGNGGNSGGGDGGNGGGNDGGNGGGNGGNGGNNGGNGGNSGGDGGNSNNGGNQGGDCPTRGKCPAVDPLDHTVHLPHLTDCGLFCRCDHGVPKLDRCPAGLHFNPKLQVCDWPDAAGCVIGACQPLSNNSRSHWEPASCANDPSQVGDKCRLVCNSEYQLSGTAEITCTDDGWSGATGIDQIPSCKTVNETGEDFVNNINNTLGQQANLLFVLDESGSVSQSNFAIELNFVKAIVNAFPLSKNRSAGVITFDSTAAVDISIKQSDTCSFLKGVDRIKYNGGGTDILRSLNLAYNEIIQNAVHNLTLVFLVTDGVSTTNPTAAADKIKSHGDALFTVGVAGYNDKQLAPLSSLDKNNAPLFFGIKSFAVFEAVADYLATKEVPVTNHPLTFKSWSSQRGAMASPERCETASGWGENDWVPKQSHQYTVCTLWRQCRLVFAHTRDHKGAEWHPAIDWPKHLAPFDAIQQWFLQALENASHTCSVGERSSDLLARTVVDDRLLLWPTRSPDLSPIENVWNMVKRRVWRYDPMPTTKDGLWKQYGGLFQEISNLVCDNVLIRMQYIFSSASTEGKVIHQLRLHPKMGALPTYLGVLLMVAVTFSVASFVTASITDGLLVADPNDCGAYYEFVKLHRYCPSGLVFNPNRQACDWPSNVNGSCNGGGGNGENGGGSGGGNGGGSNNNNSGNGTIGSDCPTRGKCPAVNSLDQTVHLPHLTDCGLFCKCDHGIPKLDRCPTGLHFNPKLQACDWPESAGCTTGGGEENGGNGGENNGENGGNGGGSGGESGGGNGGNGGGNGGNEGGNGGGSGGNGGGNGGNGAESGENGGGSSGNGGGNGGESGGNGGNGGNGGGSNNGGNQEGDCPTRGKCPAVNPLDHPVHLPHLTDCGLFCKCDHGIPKLDRCPTGLHFNPKLQVCDWPEAAGCVNGGAGENGGNGGESGGNGENGGENGGNGGNGGESGGSGGGNGENGGENGGNGGGNGGESGGNGGGNSGNGGGNGGESGGNGGNGGNGGGSNNGGNQEGDCPTRGKCPAVNPLDHPVHLPHLTDCGLFCKCDHGIPKLDRCPTGLHFNPKLQVCDWPEAAGCVNGGGGENGENGGESGGNGGGNAGNGGENTGGNGENGGNGGGNGGENNNGGNEDGDCPSREKCPAVDPLDHTVHIPHLTDCGLFCKCNHGIPKLGKCPPGLQFNPKLQVCDWPEAAGCVIGVCQPLSNNNRSHWEPSSCVNDPSEVGDRCRLVCKSEYQLSGSASIVCTEDGWSAPTGIDQIPSCKTINETAEDFVNTINETMGQKANLLFVLDESGSVSPPNFKIEQEFVKSVVSAFPLSVNRSAGVITFDSQAAVDISVRESRTCSFLDGVDRIRYNGGGTDILRALNLAYDEILANAIHNLTLVFLVTDGQSFTNPTSAADNIKSRGDVLFTVGVQGYDIKQLAPISSLDKKGSPLFYGIDNFEVFNAVANYLATKYNNGTSVSCTL